MQNARLIADAERYYRAMYYGSNESWNLRDQHMFDTLQRLLEFHGPEAKAVVWEHNSHLGDASATEMGLRGQLNVGQLCRAKHAAAAFLIGFGTDRGTVAAASDWDAPMQVMQVRAAHPESYERLCHRAGVPAFFLHLREPARDALRFELEPPRLERAIGVVYRPETEIQSHYFHASLPAAVRRVRLDRRDARGVASDPGRGPRPPARASLRVVSGSRACREAKPRGAHAGLRGAHRALFFDCRPGATCGPTPSPSATSSRSARATGETRYDELALRSIDQVHHVLGRHRSDDARTGWISGLDEREGERHPTRGGLRIGKQLPERPRAHPSTSGSSGSATASTSTI